MLNAEVDALGEMTSPAVLQPLMTSLPLHDVSMKKRELFPCVPLDPYQKSLDGHPLSALAEREMVVCSRTSQTSLPFIALST